MLAGRSLGEGQVADVEIGDHLVGTLDLDQLVAFVCVMTKAPDELFDVVDGQDQPSPSLWLAGRGSRKRATVRA